MKNPFRSRGAARHELSWDEIVIELEKTLLELVKIQAIEEYFASRPCEFCGNTERWIFEARLWDRETMVEVVRKCRKCKGSMAVSLPSEICHA